MPDEFEDQPKKKPAAAISGGKKQRFEEWALEKGHAPGGAGEVYSKCARVHMHWEDSTIISEAEYEKAVHDAQNVT